MTSAHRHSRGGQRTVDSVAIDGEAARVIGPAYAGTFGSGRRLAVNLAVRVATVASTAPPESG
jgi:hypothetical protein